MDPKDTKECAVCGKEFLRLDFPHCFNRMITCGDIECAGKRRYARWRARYDQYLSNKAYH